MAEFGISVALLTPFAADGALDTATLADHASDVLGRGATSVTLFGTTGENASIAAAERADGLACLVRAGIAPDRIVLGLCANALGDVASQIREGSEAGIRTFLLPPPSYFKGVGEDGLFEWHARAINAAGDRARFILYHIPQVTGVPLSTGIVRRIAEAFPDRIRAVKDSSGDWDTAAAFLDDRRVPVLVGDERLLHRAVARGADGAISGVANLWPERMARIVATAEEDPVVTRETGRIVARPVIPALKFLLAGRAADPDWERVRPPLEQLGEADRRALEASLDDVSA
jgi:4-hydroxy-tetrahydrodipicolinate synthase